MDFAGMKPKLFAAGLFVLQSSETIDAFAIFLSITIPLSN